MMHPLRLLFVCSLLVVVSDNVLVESASTVDQPSCGGFVTIAHMTNELGIVREAVKQNANGVEIDLNFRAGGDYTNFKHGTPCSCSIPPHVGLCSSNRCNGTTGVSSMITSLATAQPGVLLLVIDAKVADVRPNALAYAGNKVGAEIVLELFKRGYAGSVIVGVAKLTSATFIQAVYEHVRDHDPELLNRIRFSVDNEGPNAGAVVSQLKLIGAPIAYGTGRTRAGTQYIDAINSARDQGVPFTYIWTVEDVDTMERYIAAGVSAIMTDNPFRVNDLATKRGIRIAKPGEPVFCQ